MSVRPPETDDRLLSRLEAGDEAAFQVLYRRRQGAIYRFAVHVTGSEAVAEDITQEVFLTLIRNACRYDPERGTLNGYLFGIARKLVLRHLERTRMDVALDSAGDG
ncbi:MAG: sigma factor, partial [Bryobacteraceae bacterium]